MTLYTIYLSLWTQPADPNLFRGTHCTFPAANLCACKLHSGREFRIRLCNNIDIKKIFTWYKNKKKIKRCFLSFFITDLLYAVALWKCKNVGIRFFLDKFLYLLMVDVEGPMTYCTQQPARLKYLVSSPLRGRKDKKVLFDCAVKIFREKYILKKLNNLIMDGQITVPTIQ